MIAGGIGNVRPEARQRASVRRGDAAVVLGGPAMLIGLGGGAASSMASGQSSSDLDFASVQRDNAEMQRRCQEVIDACAALGDANPIRLIHDVGAGGLSNALPELVKDAGRGGRFEMRRVPSADPGLAPHETVVQRGAGTLRAGGWRTTISRCSMRICARERCPFAVVGEATRGPRLDRRRRTVPQRTGRSADGGVVRQRAASCNASFARRTSRDAPLDLPQLPLADVLDRVLRFPAVGSKQFLVTIGDRSITGFVVRDQMVGPWQVPVADAAVTTLGFKTYARRSDGDGRAIAAGVDRLRPHPARMAIGEALTNLASVAVEDSVARRACRPTGWQRPAAATRIRRCSTRCGRRHRALSRVGHRDSGRQRQPVDAYAMARRARRTRGHRADDADRLCIRARCPTCASAATPALRLDRGRTRLLLVDLGAGANRLGGSALAQTHRQLGDRALTSTMQVAWRGFFRAVQGLLARRRSRCLPRSIGRRPRSSALSRWRSPDAAGSTSTLECSVWRAKPMRIAALFAEELGGGAAGRRIGRCEGAAAVRGGRARRARA